MKKLFVICLLLLGLTSQAQQALLTNTIYGQSMFVNLAKKTSTATAILLYPNPYFINNIQFWQDPISVNTDTNGTYIFTNLQAGYYSGTVVGNPGISFNFNVWTNTLGNVPIGSLITNVGTPLPNPLNQYYTMAQVNALVTGGGGNATNNANTGTLFPLLTVSNVNQTTVIGAGIGTTNAAVDGYGGLRIQPTAGATAAYYWLNGGGANLPALNRFGASANVVAGQNLADAATGFILPFWQTLAWGDPANWSHGGFGGDAVTEEAIYGGDGSVLENLPIERAELAPAMPTPPFFLTTYAGQHINTNELAVTNMLAALSISGLTAMVTNAGGQIWVQMDDQTLFFNQHRDAAGQLNINLTNFPDGSNFAAVVHGYGAKLMVTLYYEPYPTNEVDVWGGGKSVGYPGCPAMTPNTVDVDVSKLYDFGVDGLRVADDNATAGAEMAFARHVADAVLNPQNLGAGPSQKVPYGGTTAAAGKAAALPLAVEALVLKTGYAVSGMYKQVNLLDHDGSGFPGYVVNPLFEAQVMQNWRGMYLYEMPLRGPGHFGQASTSFFPADISLGDTRLGLTLDAVGLAKVEFGFTNGAVGTSLAAILPNFTATATNAGFLQALLNKQCSPPFKLWDQGITNLSAWCKPLSGGAFAVALVNESQTITNMVVTNLACGANVQQSYAYYDCWSNVTYTAAANPTQVTKGTFLYSNVPALSAVLLLMTPTNYFAGNAGGLTNNNGALSTLVSPGSLVSSNQAALIAALSSAVVTTNIYIASAANVVNSPYNIAFYGDSLMQGSGGTNATFPMQLGALMSNNVNLLNYGAGGNTSAMVLSNRMMLHPETWAYTTLIWEGDNFETNASGVLDPTIEQTNITRMVNLLARPIGRFAILSPIMYQTYDVTNFNYMLTLSNYLQTTYGSNYLNVWQFLCAGATNIPVSLRADAIHLNTNGYGLVAQFVYSNIAVWGGDIVKPINSLGLGATLASPPPIGSSVQNRGQFTQVIASMTNVFGSTRPNLPTAAIEAWKPSGASNNVLELVNPTYAGGQEMDIDFSTYLTGQTTNNPYSRIRSTLSSGGAGQLYLSHLLSSGAIADGLSLDGSGNVWVGANGGTFGVGASGSLTTESVWGPLGLPSLTHNDTNGIFTIGSTPSWSELIFGTLTGSPYSMWMQTRNAGLDNSPAPIGINPLGGWVGIGTNNPHAALEVNGSVQVDTNLTALGPISSIGAHGSLTTLTVFGGLSAPSLTHNATNGIVSIASTTSDWSELVFGSLTGSPYSMWMQTRNASVDNSPAPIGINPLGGNVGINTNAPAYTLDVAGTINATSYANFAGPVTNWGDEHVQGTLYGNGAGVTNLPIHLSLVYSMSRAPGNVAGTANALGWSIASASSINFAFDPSQFISQLAANPTLTNIVTHFWLASTNANGANATISGNVIPITNNVLNILGTGTGYAAGTTYAPTQSGNITNVLVFTITNYIPYGIWTNMQSFYIQFQCGSPVGTNYWILPTSYISNQ